MNSSYKSHLSDQSLMKPERAKLLHCETVCHKYTVLLQQKFIHLRLKITLNKCRLLLFDEHSILGLHVVQ